MFINLTCIKTKISIVLSDSTLVAGNNYTHWHSINTYFAQFEKNRHVLYVRVYLQKSASYVTYS